MCFILLAHPICLCLEMIVCTRYTGADYIVGGYGEA